MSKQVFPTITIRNLNGTTLSQKDFLANHFAHQLYELSNLTFPYKHSFYHLVYFSKSTEYAGLTSEKFRKQNIKNQE